MIIFDMLYNITIYPIEFIIETLFFIFNRVFNFSFSTSIFFLSLSVNFISLPLYNIAENWQQKERDIQNKMKPMINNIKAVYKGDQRYLLIKTCHKINGYKTIYAFRGILGLLIQIPFFMAAYYFVYGLNNLPEGHFLFIKDFSMPDNLINISNIHINVLPITMTILSIMSAIVYSKKLNFKESMPIYITSLIFLILLYNSPSGLLFYWNINCLFSLIKNIILEYKFYRKIKISILLNILSILLIVVLIINKYDIKNILTFSVIILLTLNFNYIQKIIFKNKNLYYHFIKNRFKLLIISSLTISILSGLFIPSSLINSSISDFDNHFNLILNNFSISLGMFLFYPIFIYILFSSKVKNYISLLLSFAALIFILETFTSSASYSNMTSDFVFENQMSIIADKKDIIINIILIFFSAAFIYIIIKKIKYNLLINIYLVIILALISISVFYMVNIFNYNSYYNLISTKDKIDKNEKIFNVSEEGENIFVIILDRAIPSYWYDAFKRHHKYKKIFEGFEFYPNTVSYNYNTITIASLYGGYDYLPYEVSTNGNYNITNIHNQSILTLPLALEKYGYKSYMLDPVYANMSYKGDLSIFSNYKNIKAYSEDYIYDYSINEYTNKNNIYLYNLDSDRMIRFSIFKMIPVWLRNALYSDKEWLINKNNIINTSLSTYAMLSSIKDLININKYGNNYNILHNNVTHEPHYFLPDYTPSASSNYINNNDLIIYKDTNSVKHFYANTASINCIAEIIQFLKINNVYDNTKIIIISDHGYRINSQYLKNDNMKFIGLYNALLMYKDFNSRGKIKLNTNFMTVADMPYLAAKHIDNIKNPFNNKLITNDYKTNGANIVRIRSWKPENQERNSYDFDTYYHVHDNIFNINNWKLYQWYPKSNYSKEIDLSLGFRP
ncbi:YidC/Oxa1 family membrane protein insertase [uncultured Brachyspira sp.]|uniref:YidC/Oxa1 family membrane protein insertase n=1 Tax=uncultured Brachyspira sp. TaxID=221953 RepID=UPI00261A0DAF|nr:YidC/Oxa1 family membrane protein insertase [uncultured Brachyspira sp.]